MPISPSLPAYDPERIARIESDTSIISFSSPFIQERYPYISAEDKAYLLALCKAQYLALSFIGADA